ncbi:hypothetical protein [Streptomyces lydicus]|uniref:hypothetical protein n=1 Tax=Streptomyces lydicus TaxID=47763 RepID=UPI0036EEC88A
MERLSKAEIETAGTWVTGITADCIGGKTRPVLTGPHVPTECPQPHGLFQEAPGWRDF